MNPKRNPTPAEIAAIINSSEHKAAKWIKDAATGDMYYFPPEQSTHADMAASLGVAKYEKGLVVLEPKDGDPGASA